MCVCVCVRAPVCARAAFRPCAFAPPRSRAPLRSRPPPRSRAALPVRVPTAFATAAAIMLLAPFCPREWSRRAQDPRCTEVGFASRALAPSGSVSGLLPTAPKLRCVPSGLAAEQITWVGWCGGIAAAWRQGTTTEVQRQRRSGWKGGQNAECDARNTRDTCVVAAERINAGILPARKVAKTIWDRVENRRF